MEHGAQSWWTNTGYDEISLMSLSSGDYSCLPAAGAPDGGGIRRRTRVKISLPSQRIDAVLTDTLKETQKVRKTGADARARRRARSACAT